MQLIFMWYRVLGGALIVGKLAIDYFAAQEKEKRLIASGIHEIDCMTGKEFELFLSACYKKTGYDVALTPSSQDYGADLILKKNGIKIIVQAKRSKGAISVQAVQEVVGAIQYYKADRALVVTNNRFTKNALILASSNKVELWDRERLIDFILQVKSS